ncbi:MAG: [protein-PII] uridylyltransferase [Gammaproteobacteria bacterium]|nr:[protein-PII] uridylyltransferase [Gammaproteobacteria bacterium]
MAAQLDEALFNLPQFESALSTQPNKNIPLFRHALTSAYAEMSERFWAGRSATELVYMQASLIDEILSHAWRQFFSATDKNIALMAVGGYGRGELHPHSDIDILILLRKSPKPYKDAIVAFTTFLWDIGLEVGHSVRTLKECVNEAKRDITVATNMLESRLLLGPQELADEHKTLTGPKKIWPSDRFFAEKVQEQHQRHLKFNDTAYNLEPNIKDGPGGLRDIQMIGWVAKRHFAADTLHDLVKHDFLTEEEYKALHEGQAFLWQIRYGLHLLAKRREDRLLFDHQRTLAAKFGYQDDSRSRGVEKFMKQYYRTIMELSRLNEMLLQLFSEEIIEKHASAKPTRINKRFQIRKGYLETVSETTFRLYPFALLEVFLLLAQHPEIKGVSANTIRLIREHRYLIDAGFRNDVRCSSLFMEILRQPRGITQQLRRMNRYGILAAYIPLFGNIVGQMQHDLFHVYTVDEHILMVIRNVRRFTVPSYRNEFPLCSELMQEIPKQELLLLAALFHDIAKGRGGDHSELGATDAAQFCRQHGLSEYDSHLVSWLVAQHLIMSTTAQRKDISDPQVVHDFACLVGDLNHLNYIYLLTVADIRGTSPSVWNSWKDSLLRELYFATRSALRRGLDAPVRASESITENKTNARNKLASQNISNEALDSLWERFEDEYFLRYSADEIAWHAEGILKTTESDLPLIMIRHASVRGGTEIFIYNRAHDRMFAHITGTLEQLGLTIADARILVSKDGYALDTYVALDESGKPVTDHFRLNDLIKRLHTRLHTPEMELPKPQQQIPRQSKAFTVTTDVNFWMDRNNQRTAMQVTARDRPGLLSRIARALLECDVLLQNAKVATFGERAEDIFYITDKDGAPITDEAAYNKLRETIQRNLTD